MKITLAIGDVAFSVPATLPVRLPSTEPGGNQQAPRLPDYNLPLSAFDSITLDRLCREFRAEVFNKANKEQPPEQGISKEKPLAALDRLKSVLCDPGGMISIVGSDGDAAVIKRALQDLDTFLASL